MTTAFEVQGVRDKLGWNGEGRGSVGWPENRWEVKVEAARRTLSLF